ncbi:MAG TPA: GNAT family N-acetyltransferase, partial [Chloroflexia bacterium]
RAARRARHPVADMDHCGIHRQVADLHLASIGQGFLSTLGPAFLTLLYESMDTADHSVLLVEIRDDCVAGFVAGGHGMGPIYRRMLGKPFRLIRALFPSLFRPERLLRILEILRYGRATDPALPKAELLSIAVAPAYRGQGIADALYRRLVGYFNSQGTDAFKITVGEHLGPAHRFYLRMGAEPVSSVEVHRGEGSVVYIHRLG